MDNRYEIYRGREIGGKLVGLRLCGYAFKKDEDSYYRVKLLLLSENVYYMSKNQGPGYTIFSKIVTDAEGNVSFQNPVGFARLMDQVRTHLYVRFPDLASHMFMCLFPTEKLQTAA